MSQLLLVAARWAMAAAICVVVLWYANYLLGGATADIFEELSLPAAMGRLVGRGVAGFVSGYMLATLGGPHVRARVQ